MRLKALLAVVGAGLGLLAVLGLAACAVARRGAGQRRAERPRALPVRDKRIVTKGGGNH